MKSPESAKTPTFYSSDAARTPKRLKRVNTDQPARRKFLLGLGAVVGVTAASVLGYEIGKLSGIDGVSLDPRDHGITLTISKR